MMVQLGDDEAPSYKGTGFGWREAETEVRDSGSVFEDLEMG